MQTIFTTPRTQVRQFTADEESLLQAINNDAQVSRYLPPRTPEQLHNYFKQIHTDYQAEAGFGRWAVINPVNNHFMGTCMLVPARPGLSGMELGYSLHTQYWGQGIATEIVQALISYGFDRGLNEICAITDPENIASQRVLSKAGFINSATVFIFEKYLPLFKIQKGNV